MTSDNQNYMDNRMTANQEYNIMCGFNRQRLYPDWFPDEPNEHKRYGLMRDRWQRMIRGLRISKQEASVLITDYRLGRYDAVRARIKELVEEQIKTKI